MMPKMLSYGVGVIRDLGKRYVPEIPQDAGLFETCYVGVQTILKLDDQRTLDNLKQRFINNDNYLKAFLDVDEIDVVIDHEEMEDLLEDKEKEKQKKNAAKQFARAWKTKLRDVRGEAPKIGSKHHPLTGCTWAVKEFPQDGTSKIEQKEAKLLLPPGASIWVGHASTHKKGAWCSHYPPFKRFSITWEAAGSERAAVLSNVQHCWRLFCLDNNLPLSHCPIKGIFSD